MSLLKRLTLWRWEKVIEPKLIEQARELLTLRVKLNTNHMLDKADADRCDALIESIGRLLGAKPCN